MMFIANLLSRADTIDQVRDTLIDLTRRTSAEPGAVSYHAVQSTSDPTHFNVVEHYCDRAAWEAHMASPHVRDALSAFDNLLREPPAAMTFEVFSEYTAAPPDRQTM